MSIPLVSVVIPVYKRPVAVRRAIASVLAQTYQAFEIIVVDDGSTDGTYEAVAAMRDPRIRLIRHRTNRGGGAARNTAIRASLARFIAFLDSDDEWLPPKIERQLMAFARGDNRLGLVYTGVYLNNPDGRVQVRMARPQRDPARALLTRNVIGETSVAMVRREVLDAVGGFDETLPSSQDKDLWLRIAARFTLGCLPEPLVRIERANGGRISTDVTSWLTGRELFYRKHKDTLVREGLCHRFLRDTAWVHLRRARDGRAARRCCLQAIAASPFSPVTPALLALSCLPMAWLDRMATWKHRLIAAFERSSARSGDSREVTTRA